MSYVRIVLGQSYCTREYIHRNTLCQKVFFILHVQYIEIHCEPKDEVEKGTLRHVQQDVFNVKMHRVAS